MSSPISAALAGDSAAPSAPAPSPAAGNADGQASVGSGNAPGVGGDAEAGGQTAQATPPAVPASKYRFLDREWNDQAHAEGAIKSQIGRVSSVQHENAELKRQATALQAELEALRGALVSRQIPGAGQGAPQGRQAPDAAPQSLADTLAKDGTLEFVSKIAQDPELGMGHAMYAMAQAIEKAMTERDQRIEERFATSDQRQQTERFVAQGFSAAKRLAAEGFPELDDNNKNPEAVEAQQYILEFLRDIPPDRFAENPGKYLRMAALDYRYSHGTPVFAQAPGSSGSPSSLLAQAAEAATPAATPMTGTGVPRPGNGAESPMDRLRRENREANAKVVRTPAGRPLFEAS